MPSIGEELFELGWRGGSVLPVELYEQIRHHLHHTDCKAPEHIDPDSWLIVVSQSCDIVVPKDDAEPYVELLWAHSHAEKPRTQYCDLRSTRNLDFRQNREKLPHVVLTAHASIDRFIVPRSVLRGNCPDINRTLSVEAIKKLHAWFALRYNRPAWPNVFVYRIQPARKDLVAALRPLADDVVAVRVGISPKGQELDNEVYRVVVFFIVPAEKFQNSPETRRLVQKGFNKFVSASEN